MKIFLIVYDICHYDGTHVKGNKVINMNTITAFDVQSITEDLETEFPDCVRVVITNIVTLNV